MTHSRRSSLLLLHVLLCVILVLPLDNGDGNAAKIFVFNPEGDQISFVPTADANAQLSAAG